MLDLKVAKFFSSIPSTNVALFTDVEARPELLHGTVYLSQAQAAGRGQGKNGWHSSPGDNLTMSLLLKPDRLSPDRLFALNALTSLAVADALEPLLPPHLACLISVKWPNDVYVGDRKIAGILIQNSLRGKHVHWSIVGIGLNVNESAFPPELETTATSLRLLLGSEVPLDEVLQLLFHHLSQRYEDLHSGRFSALKTDYRNRLYQIDREARYVRMANNERFLATITGVNESGLLELRHLNGTHECFDVQQLRYLRD